MIQAHSYTPAIVYVEAGEAITKHMVVCMAIGGKIYPATPALGPVLGVALTNANEGDFLTVQTDGVLYNYEGSAGELYPGCWYHSTYSPPGGMVTGGDDGYTIGIAINAKTLQLRFAGQGTGSVEPPAVGDIDGGDLAEITEDWDDWDGIDGGSLSDWEEDISTAAPVIEAGQSLTLVVGEPMEAYTVQAQNVTVGESVDVDSLWDSWPSIALSGSLSTWASLFED